MRGTIPPLPQYVFMELCLVRPRTTLPLPLLIKGGSSLSILEFGSYLQENTLLFLCYKDMVFTMHTEVITVYFEDQTKSINAFYERNAVRERTSL
jgi:hypothetical protein